jgi:hypothetical protein
VIKLVCFFRRHPALSREQFHDHWRGRHGSLIAETPELAQHIVRYEQNHRLADDYARDPEGAPGFDGATVQWMESMKSFGAFVREPKYAERIAPDEAFMLDRSSIQLLFTHEETVQVDGETSRAGLKLSALLQRRAGTNAAGFHAHWAGPHAALLRQHDELSRHVLGYHQSPRLERDYERDAGGGWDGLAEQWFASHADFEAMRAEPAYTQVTADLAEFADPAATQSILSGPPDVIIG